MEAIRIAICDDEAYYREELQKLISVYGNEYETNVTVTCFDDMEELSRLICEGKAKYDLLLLDVEMPGCTGIEGAKRIREADKEVVLCFVTSHDKYALSAFEVDALGYVVKPVKYVDIKRQIEKAKVLIYYNKDAAEAEKRYVKVSSNKEDIIIDTEKVIYIEKRRNRCVFHMNDSEIVCYDTLKKVYEKLDRQRFLFTHQGFIANFDYIKEVKKNVVCFGNNMEIPISRKFYTDVRDKHLDKIYRLRSSKNRELNHKIPKYQTSNN